VDDDGFRAGVRDDVQHVRDCSRLGYRWACGKERCHVLAVFLRCAAPKEVEVFLVLRVDVQRSVDVCDLLESPIEPSLVVHQQWAEARRHERLERRRTGVGECGNVARPDVFLGDRSEQREVHVRLRSEDVGFGLEAIDGEHRRDRVRHLDDRRDASCSRCSGPRLHALLLGISWFPEVDVAIHETGEDDLAVERDPFLRIQRHTLASTMWLIEPSVTPSVAFRNSPLSSNCPPVTDRSVDGIHYSLAGTVLILTFETPAPENRTVAPQWRAYGGFTSEGANGRLDWGGSG